MYVFGFSSDHIRHSITVWAEFLKVCFQAAAVASGWRDEAWNLTKEWKGLHRRHLTAVKTQTLTQRKDWMPTSGDCAPWIPFIKTLFALADKLRPQRNWLPGKDGCGMLSSWRKTLTAVARGESPRLRKELVLEWGGNLVFGTGSVGQKNTFL